MAKEIKNERAEAVVEAVSKTEQFFEKNGKLISIICGAVVVLCIVVFGWHKLIHQPKVAEAQGQMSFAEENFRNAADSTGYALALYGDGNILGFEQIEKEYGFDRLFYRLSDIAAGVPTGDTFEITILDDVLATGGTAEGVAKSLEQLTIYREGKPYKVRIKEFVFLVGIPEIGGRERLEKIAPVTVLMNI